MEEMGETQGDRSADFLLKRLNAGGTDALGPVLGICAQAQSLLCMGALIIPAGVAAVAGGLASANTAQEAAAIEKAFEQPFNQHTLRDDIIRTARDSVGQLIQVFDGTAQGNADTILKIESVTRGLLGGTIQFPERKGLIFYMTARVRLIQEATQKELYAGQIEHLGRTMPLADWGANDAQRLREEFDLASRVVAEKIVDTLFLLYRFTEPDFH
jgi:hypothetical protein